MRIEWWILVATWVVATGLLFFIPKNKARLAAAAFVFKQFTTFISGLAVVELGFIEYPFRLFASVNRTSFSYEFYDLPAVCAAFLVWYPKGRSKLFQLAYYVGITSVLTVLEVIIEKYTDLINYLHWTWYVTWITIGINFLIVHLLCLWFFKKGKIPE